MYTANEFIRININNKTIIPVDAIALKSSLGNEAQVYI